MIHKLFYILILLAVPVFSVSAHKTTPEFSLDGQYKILIVPGHDEESTGAVFRDTKEEDMNIKLGLFLANLFSASGGKKDPNWEVYITRDWDGYQEWLLDYLEANKENIADFQEIISQTVTDEHAFNVVHLDAQAEMRTRLYGINKWADENQIDAIIHIHFNDYPRKNPSQRGDYKGFAIYFPESQFKNSFKSFALGSFIFQELFKNYPVSDYLPESLGLVPEQKLIAVGPDNSLNVPAILIEYGYIYETRFSAFWKRDAELRKMSQATYNGLKNYFRYLEFIAKK